MAGEEPPEFLEQSFQSWLHFSDIASIQFSSGNALVLSKALFSCLGNNSVVFHSGSLYLVFHSFNPHLTGINGPWSCVHLSVGVSLDAVWVGLSPTCFCSEEFLRLLELWQVLKPSSTVPCGEKMGSWQLEKWQEHKAEREFQLVLSWKQEMVLYQSGLEIPLLKASWRYVHARG